MAQNKVMVLTFDNTVVSATAAGDAIVEATLSDFAGQTGVITSLAAMDGSRMVAYKYDGAKTGYYVPDTETIGYGSNAYNWSSVSFDGTIAVAIVDFGRYAIIDAESGLTLAINDIGDDGHSGFLVTPNKLATHTATAAIGMSPDISFVDVASRAEVAVYTGTTPSIIVAARRAGNDVFVGITKTDFTVFSDRGVVVATGLLASTLGPSDSTNESAATTNRNGRYVICSLGTDISEGTNVHQLIDVETATAVDFPTPDSVSLSAGVSSAYYHTVPVANSTGDLFAFACRPIDVFDQSNIIFHTLDGTVSGNTLFPGQHVYTNNVSRSGYLVFTDEVTPPAPPFWTAFEKTREVIE